MCWKGTLPPLHFQKWGDYGNVKPNDIFFWLVGYEILDFRVISWSVYPLSCALKVFAPTFQSTYKVCALQDPYKSFPIHIYTSAKIRQNYNFCYTFFILRILVYSKYKNCAHHIEQTHFDMQKMNSWKKEDKNIEPCNIKSFYCIVWVA